MYYKKTAIAALLGASLILGACNGAGSSEVNGIYTRLNQQDRQIQMLNDQLGIGTSKTSSGIPSQADTWAKINSMSQDLNILKGQLEDMTGGEGSSFAAMQNKLGQLESAVRQLSSQLAIDLPMLDGAGGSTFTAPSAQLSPAASTAGSTASAAGKTAATGAGLVAGTAAGAAATADKAKAAQTSESLAQKLYNSGTKAFSSRKYSESVKIFSDFVTTYPKHKLTSNAYYWQGESYYQLKNYSNAILSYQQVIEKFPTSAKMQGALLKQGVSMHNRGQKDAAKIRLNELIKKFPKSPEADRAKDFLQKNP